MTWKYVGHPYGHHRWTKLRASDAASVIYEPAKSAVYMRVMATCECMSCKERKRNEWIRHLRNIGTLPPKMKTLHLGLKTSYSMMTTYCVIVCFVPYIGTRMDTLPLPLIVT